MSQYGKLLEYILQSMSNPLQTGVRHVFQLMSWWGFLGDEVLLCQHIGALQPLAKARVASISTRMNHSQQITRLAICRIAWCLDIPTQATDLQTTDQRMFR
ncbi:uncharacterized protein CLUP02_14032 [Colletotrichum lupini]|uniref:Uncharacterized protein n=1 Tax=Colletotrichum lupini TaxID=145971 RepID=A0A9Q8WMP5_9PEZI|nr:uncharacterized protein CLUP02_14032 [Colletotrichum lupini]UQC88507.1 hypothetical protein CLUP02_14032 [Colletotrichum lupini]